MPNTSIIKNHKDHQLTGLKPRLAKLVRQKVASGEYPNELAVVEKALALLAHTEDDRRAWLAAGEKTFAKVWGNRFDAVYDRL